MNTPNVNPTSNDLTPEEWVAKLRQSEAEAETQGSPPLDTPAERTHWSLLDIDPKDHSTWTPTMQQRRAQMVANEGVGILDGDHGEQAFQNLKWAILFEVTEAATIRPYSFLEACLSELRERAPQGSFESVLLFHLDGTVHEIVSNTIDTCLELVPRLQRLLPYNSGREILEALEAEDADTGGEQAP